VYYGRNIHAMPKYTPDTPEGSTRVTIWLKRETYNLLSKIAKLRDRSRTKVVEHLILNAPEAETGEIRQHERAK